MKLIISFLIAGFLAITAAATEIIFESQPKELKTYSKQVTVKTRCELIPAQSDREGGVAGPFCSCVNAWHEIESVLRASQSSIKEIRMPAPAELFQSLSECGHKDYLVSGLVVFTGN